MLRLLVVFLAAAGFGFGFLRSLDLALSILTCRRPLRCIGLGLVALGALAGFGVGAAGRLSPPGQALKTWTSLTLRPLSSGGLAQVARTFRLTFSIHLEKEERGYYFIKNSEKTISTRGSYSNSEWSVIMCYWGIGSNLIIYIGEESSQIKTLTGIKCALCCLEGTV